MADKYVIGFPSATEKVRGTDRSMVNQNEINAIILSGGTPILIPTQDPTIIDNYLPLIDGLLLPGGDDIAPRFFGEEPIPEIGPTNMLQDESEIALIQGAIDRHIPIFGICRGIQILNVALGGTVYQDLSAQINKPILQHYQKAQMDQGTHYVKITSDSHLKSVIGEQKLLVNSHHHQAVKAVANPLTVTAKSSDGVIEAVETQDKLAIAVQWHPETMYLQNPQMTSLFADFMTRVKQFQ